MGSKIQSKYQVTLFHLFPLKKEFPLITIQFFFLFRSFLFKSFYGFKDIWERHLRPMCLCSHFCQVNPFYIKPSSKNQELWFHGFLSQGSTALLICAEASLNKHHHHQKQPTSTSMVMPTTRHTFKAAFRGLSDNGSTPTKSLHSVQMHTWGLPLGARISPMASIRNRTALDIIGWTLGFFIQLIHTTQTLLYTAGT